LSKFAGRFCTVSESIDARFLRSWVKNADSV
jgi:hypothetical protein